MLIRLFSTYLGFILLPLLVFCHNPLRLLSLKKPRLELDQEYQDYHHRLDDLYHQPDYKGKSKKMIQKYEEKTAPEKYLYLKPRIHPADSYYHNDKKYYSPQMNKPKQTKKSISLREDHDQHRYDDEVLSHITGADEVPHQYAVQVRWRQPKKPDFKYRLHNDEKTRYRNFAHQEEEHWHDKDWIDVGLPPEVVKEAPKVDNKLYAYDSRFSTLPVYAKPMKNSASSNKIRKHFSVPSKSFPVNKKFVKWSNAPIEFDSNRRKDSSPKKFPFLDKLPYNPTLPKDSFYYHFK